MRCLALAKAMRELDCTSVFAVGPETATTVPALTRAGFDVLVVDSDMKNVMETLANRFASDVDWMIFDHYGIDAEAETLCRPIARNIMVIDDLADRIHDCDVLLDQGSGRAEEAYAELVPAHASVLTGPHYALLDPKYGDYRDRRLPANPDGRAEIFVSFGATDPGNHTRQGLDVLAASAIDRRVNVVLGSAAPHLEDVRAYIGSSKFEATLHVDTPDILSLLANSRLAVGAGGVSALERCCCGVPSIIAVTADNQRTAAAGVCAAGAAELMDPGDLTNASGLISDVIASPEKLRRMALAGMLLCDGRGTRRIAMTLAPERSSDGADVRLRPARADDEDIILEWQQAPGARRFARNPDAPDADTHAAWMQATLDDPEILLNIVECEGRAAGLVRLDRRAARGSLPAFEVSILVASDQHRRGIGKAALALARRLAPGVVLQAAIHPDNSASLSLFMASGYAADGADFACWPEGAEPDATAATGEFNG